MTLKQIKQKEFESEVCEMFAKTAESMPLASMHRIAVTMAQKTGLSPEGIKKILKRNNINFPAHAG